MSAEAQSRFLPADEYKRAVAVDYAKMASVQKAFSDAYLKQVR
jgi:putative spermidine/putrescine transport system substrate-binding protein